MGSKHEGASMGVDGRQAREGRAGGRGLGGRRRRAGGGALRALTDHMCRHLSKDPLARYWPSGEKATE